MGNFPGPQTDTLELCTKADDQIQKRSILMSQVKKQSYPFEEVSKVQEAYVTFSLILAVELHESPNYANDAIIIHLNAGIIDPFAQRFV